MDNLYHLRSLDYLIKEFKATVTYVGQLVSTRVTSLWTWKSQNQRESTKTLTFQRHLNYEKISNLSVIYIDRKLQEKRRMTSRHNYISRELVSNGYFYHRKYQLIT
jgi:hypothetical protein